jgi:hypothetical protein
MDKQSFMELLVSPDVSNIELAESILIGMPELAKDSEIICLIQCLKHSSWNFHSVQPLPESRRFSRRIRLEFDPKFGARNLKMIAGKSDFWRETFNEKPGFWERNFEEKTCFEKRRFPHYSIVRK